MGSQGKSGSGEVLGLGAIIRLRRKVLNLSQAELAALAGVGLAFMYELEHEKPTVRLDKVLAILEVLGLELHVREGKQRITAAASLREKAPS